ncbi:MAG TPA: hypothetical protein VFU89_07985 [Rhabdochlamydiaceae bacterium]|nr:hypothetical protein [Rhabdochlamydiaceae bacterium]
MAALLPLATLSRDIFTPGVAGYIFCLAFNQHHAFEKAALVTMLVVQRFLAQVVILGIRQETLDKTSAPTRFMFICANLLSIPSTLYLGRLCNFRTHDYLQILGLGAIGTAITNGCIALYQVVAPSKRHNTVVPSKRQ